VAYLIRCPDFFDLYPESATAPADYDRGQPRLLEVLERHDPAPKPLCLPAVFAAFHDTGIAHHMLSAGTNHGEMDFSLSPSSVLDRSLSFPGILSP